MIFYFTILPGIPTIVALSITSFNTTAFAPILTLSPILIFPRIFAPHPIITLFPIVGCLFPLSNPLPPNVTPWYIVTLSLIIVVSPITIPVP